MTGHLRSPAPGLAPEIERATSFRTVVVIGGGCYGTFYATQLRRALDRGRITAERVVLVDRDPACQAARELPPDPGRELVVSGWGDFLDRFFDRDPPPPGQPDDAIVPSPLMPHLMAEWLLRVTRRSAPGRGAVFVPATEPFGTPYDVLGRDGNRYVSFADWICPTHCVEPHLCPVIRAPRTWEMGDAVERYVARLARGRPTAGPAMFITRHRAFGVGMFDGREARLAREALAGALDAEQPTDLVVATISSCHGAVGILRLG